MIGNILCIDWIKPLIFGLNFSLGIIALALLLKCLLKKTLLIKLSKEIKNYKYRIKKLNDAKSHLKSLKENRIIQNHIKEIDKLINVTKNEYQNSEIEELKTKYLKEYKEEKKITLFKGYYPTESLVNSFLPNFRRYWWSIIVLYFFLFLQFCCDEKHKEEISLKKEITTYVNLESKKGVEWKKEYEKKLVKLDTTNINSFKAKPVNIDSFIQKGLKLLQNDTILNPDSIIDNIFKSKFKQTNDSLSSKEKSDFLKLKKCFGVDTSEYSKFKKKNRRCINLVGDSIRESIINEVESTFTHTYKYHNLKLKIKRGDAFKKDTLLIEKRQVNRYSDDLSKYTFNWLTNSVNTLSGLCLYLCYLALLLATQEKDDKKHVEISRSYKSGGIYLFVGLIIIDFLVSIIDYYSAIDHKQLLMFLSYFSGLASSFTVFLLAGKLDSRLLKAGNYYLLIICLYVYGAIQPLFFIFSDGNDEAIAALMSIAFVLKFLLLWLFCYLIKSNKLLFFVYELRHLYNSQENEFKNIEDLKEEYEQKKESKINKS